MYLCVFILNPFLRAGVLTSFMASVPVAWKSPRMSLHGCPACKCKFPPNPEALLEDELRDVIAHELEWFENPIVRIGPLANAIVPMLESRRRPGKRSMAEALRRLGFTSRVARVDAWNYGKPVSAWCKDWTGEPSSRDPYVPAALLPA